MLETERLIQVVVEDVYTDGPGRGWTVEPYTAPRRGRLPAFAAPARAVEPVRCGDA